MRAVREDFVIQLHQRRGAFWEAVRTLRNRWSVAPRSGLPSVTHPPGFTGFHPENIPEGSWNEDWLRDVNSIISQLVPEKLRFIEVLSSWKDFVSVCVASDPLVPGLVEFSERLAPQRGGQVILGPGPAKRAFEKLMEGGSPRPIVLPPIKQIEDPEQARAAEARNQQDILETVWEIYVKPRGIGFGEMLYETLKSESFNRKVDEWNRNKPPSTIGHYIEVDEYTTGRDVQETFSRLAATQETRPPKHPTKKNRLLSVECAILHDDHGWKYEQLAEHYGWQQPNSASKHIKSGRETLEELIQKSNDF